MKIVDPATTNPKEMQPKRDHWAKIFVEQIFKDEKLWLKLYPCVEKSKESKGHTETMRNLVKK
jgi:hypothetical protein